MKITLRLVKLRTFFCTTSIKGLIPSRNLTSGSNSAGEEGVEGPSFLASLVADSERGSPWPCASRACFLRARLESVVSLIADDWGMQLRLEC